MRITGKGEYDDIRVNYRALGGTVWSNQPMYPTGDGYVASLVATGILEKGFEYFILARPADPDLPPLSSGTFTGPPWMPRSTPRARGRRGRRRARRWPPRPRP